MTATIMKSVNIGIRISKETLNKLDRHKGYYSRNRFLCKILDEHVAQLERVKEEQKGVRGVGCQAESPTTTSNVLSTDSTYGGSKSK